MCRYMLSDADNFFELIDNSECFDDVVKNANMKADELMIFLKSLTDDTSPQSYQFIEEETNNGSARIPGDRMTLK